MANVLNKLTLEYRQSVNTPEYDPRDWIINPDISAVRNIPKRYWKLENGNVIEMSNEEKQTVDNPPKSNEELLLRKVANGDATEADIQNAIPILAKRILGSV